MKTSFFKKTLIRIIIIVGVLLLYNQFVAPIYNIKLHRFVNNFEKIPLPDKTKQIGKTYKDFGNLGPTGNYCDYYAGKLIQTSLSEEELKTYYSQYTIPPVDPDKTMAFSTEKEKDKPVWVDVEKPSESPFRNSYYETLMKRFKVNRRIVEDQGIFLISSPDKYKSKYIICH